MVKSGMVLLTEREKADITNADVTVNWKLQTVAETVVNARERS
jgi:hypothetical protein